MTKKLFYDKNGGGGGMNKQESGLDPVLRKSKVSCHCVYKNGINTG